MYRQHCQCHHQLTVAHQRSSIVKYTALVNVTTAIGSIITFTIARIIIKSAFHRVGILAQTFPCEGLVLPLLRILLWVSLTGMDALEALEELPSISHDGALASAIACTSDSAISMAITLAALGQRQALIASTGSVGGSDSANSGRSGKRGCRGCGRGPDTSKRFIGEEEDAAWPLPHKRGSWCKECFAAHRHLHSDTCPLQLFDGWVTNH